MFERLQVSRMAHAFAAHAAARQSAIATNVAHADTPGYRARDVEDFVTHYRRIQAEGSRALTPPPPRLRPQDPGAALSPNGNSVALEAEMMKAAAARHQFDMALGITRSVSAVVRASLGR